MVIKLTKEESDFIKNHSSVIDGKWFYIPFWYHQVGENLWEQVRYENLPQYVIDTIKSLREPDEKPTN